MAQDKQSQVDVDLLDREQARILRRNRKGAITKHLRSLRRLVTDEDIDGVKARLAQLKESFESFESAHDAYYNMLDQTDTDILDKSDASFASVEENYIAGVDSAKTWLKSQGIETVMVAANPTAAGVGPTTAAAASPTVGASASVAHLQQADVVEVLSMPKVEIETFCGDPLRYQAFLSLFDETVHNKKVDDHAKLTRLLQYTDGQAKSAIRNCAVVGGSKGYQQAREILKRRFGNKHLVSQRILADLRNGKPVSKGIDFSQLADDLSTAVITLEGMGMTNEIDNQHIVLDILERCPQYIRNKWRTKALKVKDDTDEYPKFADFVTFIKQVASFNSAPLYGSSEKTSGVKSRVSKAATYNASGSSDAGSTKHLPNSGASNVNVKQSRSCVVCHQDHRLFHCGQFKGMSPQARLDVVKRHKLCFNCLMDNHMVGTCRKPSVCSVPGCGRKHTKFIHIDNPVTNSNGTDSHASAPGGETENRAGTNGNIIGECASTAMLPVVRVIVNNEFQAFALLDSGSTCSFISESLASRLKLTGKVVNYHMTTLMHQNNLKTRVVTFDLTSEHGDPPVKLTNVLVIPDIKTRYTRPEIDTYKYPHLEGIPLENFDNEKVDLIIGMDNAFLHTALESVSNPDRNSDPVAVRTHFGWTLNGLLGDPSQTVHAHFVSLDQQVENLWRLEAYDEDAMTMSNDDRKVMDMWDKDVLLENGHYSLPIPWRDGRPNLPHNKFQAQCRLRSLVKKLNRTDMMEKYTNNIDEMLVKGYAEPVPESELCLQDGSVWFLPHHAVVSEAKPDKVRVVFDCAAQQSGVSLNSQCYQGPDLVNKLIDVLLRFRQYEYGIMGDIEAMYLQVRVPQHDRNALRFLWCRNGQETELRMTSHLFGGVWCSASSTYALRRTVVDNPCSELVKDVVMRSFYVDDLATSVQSTSEALQVINETKQVVKQGGFNLTKFVVSDPELLDQIDPADRAKEVKVIKPAMMSKALGIIWEVSEDQFHYVSKHTVDQSTVTRRSILQQVASLYDPLGLILPVVFRGRAIFQDATRLKLRWDDPVPDNISQKWSTWLESLSELDSLKFCRCILPGHFTDGVIELHHFCDGSQLGYGACTYIRAINASGQINVALVASKARLAPIKSQTIPRLELCGAVLAIKLDKQMRRVLDIPVVSSTFWTDSTIVLSYLHNDSKRYKVFVANRVSEIRQNSTPSQWRHVSGDDNPADVLSRGCCVSDMPQIWFHGPSFLSDYKSNWPVKLETPVRLSNDDPDVISGQLACLADVQNTAQQTSDEQTVHPFQRLCSHYSSYYKLKKAICWLLRVCNKLRGNGLTVGPVTVPEMHHAENLLLRYVQNCAYHDEMVSLRTRGHVTKSSAVSKLCPSIKDGLMVVGGRLKHAAIPEKCKYPVILPHDHPVSHLIVRDHHGYAHLGTEWVLGQLRAKFWITKARNLIKNVKRNCVTCKKLYASTMTQKMANLPPERCQPLLSPFAYTGVDVFGHFFVKRGRHEVKRYGCVFTCFNTRAIHMEMLEALDTDSFINAFVRFVSRRSCPQKIWSDNGTNLVGARAELSRSMRQLDRAKVIQAARRRDVEWVFNPPLASHHGGVWERMIRTIRRVLVAILNSTQHITDNVLHTALCEVEGIVNSRPITKLGDGIDDCDALTPNHILLLRQNPSFAWGKFDDNDKYRRKWRQVQLIAEQFWRRWTREYLHELQMRPKWLNVKPNLQIGDVVLMVDESRPRGHWPLGRVLEINTGRDGLVRSAKLRTKDSVFVRPITKLVFLEGTE